jgi:hypothetical protein
MGFSVIAHQACPVNGKNHMKVLKCHIMDNLVISPLEE